MLGMKTLINTAAWELNDDMHMKAFSITLFKCHSDAINVLDTTLLMLFHRNSIGLMSGEYGGIPA